jgi:hypothetical protein
MKRFMTLCIEAEGWVAINHELAGKGLEQEGTKPENNEASSSLDAFQLEHVLFCRAQTLQQLSNRK